MNDERKTKKQQFEELAALMQLIPESGISGIHSESGVTEPWRF